MDVETRHKHSDQAARALCERIARYFDQQEPAEEGIVVTVTAALPGPYQVDFGVECTLTFTLPDHQTLDGCLRVDNTGGNLYAVEGRVNEAAASFTLSLEEPALGAQDQYGEELCTFLSEEVKRQAGELFLRKSSP